MNCDVTYLSDLFYMDKETAINAAKNIIYKYEKPLEKWKWDAVCITEMGNHTWRMFEKVRNDNNERFIGIITETLILKNN